MEPSWLSVKVHPHAKKDMLVAVGPGRYEAWVRAKPIERQANDAVTALLMRHLQLPRAKVQLVRGHMSRHKVFRVVG